MVLTHSKMSCLSVLGVLGALAGNGLAAVVPFTEDFSNDAANWFDADGLNLVTWVAAGGPDGSAYVSTTYTVPDPLPTFGAALFRGQDGFDSSNDAFVGDWIADGVTEFSFFMRHDATGPLDVFSRFATSANFPGAVGVPFFSVPANVWIEITIPIFPGSPNIILEGPISFEDVFSNVGNLQLGFVPTVDFIGETITFDLDKVTIAPAPGGRALLAGGLVVRRRRARDRRARR